MIFLFWSLFIQVNILFLSLLNWGRFLFWSTLEHLLFWDIFNLGTFHFVFSKNFKWRMGNQKSPLGGSHANLNAVGRPLRAKGCFLQFLKEQGKRGQWPPSPCPSSTHQTRLHSSTAECPAHSTVQRKTSFK